MPAGASPKREKEYRKIKGKMKASGRYKGREEEVAARIVNKQRAESGEAKSSSRSAKSSSKSSTRGSSATKAKKGTTSARSRSKSASSSRKATPKRSTKSSAKSATKSSAKKATGSRRASSTRSARTSSAAPKKSGSASRKSTTTRKSPSKSTRTSRTSASRGAASKSAGGSARSSTRGTTSHRRASPSRAQGAAQVTIDHEQIKQWVEDHGGCPAQVKRTSGRNGAGLLRIDYPGYSGQKSLETISWDDFFEKFDSSKLAFLYQDRTKSGRPSRFSKLVSRDTVDVH